MIKRIFKPEFWFYLSFLVFLSPLNAEIAIPRLQAPVTDQVGVLSQQVKAQLNESLTRLYQTGGSQLAILIISSLDGEPIENFSMRVSEDWKLGSAKQDNGILLTLSIEDRILRIEVGAGLEGEITDVVSNRIIEEDIVPHLKQQNYDAAILSGVQGILFRTDPKFSLGIEASRQVQPQLGPENQGRQQLSWWRILMFAVVIGFMLFTKVGRMILFAFLLSGRGGGGRGGGGLGGGFGGGGGTFSGGGASGRW